MIVKYVSPEMISNQECEYKGKKTGKLEAIAFLKEKAPNNEKLILCKCECGNRTKIRLSQFKQSAVLSCGCLRTEKKKEEKYNRWLPKLNDKVEVNEEKIYFFQFMQKTRMSRDEIVKKIQNAHTWSKIYNDRMDELNGVKKKKKKYKPRKVINYGE